MILSGNHAMHEGGAIYVQPTDNWVGQAHLVLPTPLRQVKENPAQSVHKKSRLKENTFCAHKENVLNPCVN